MKKIKLMFFNYFNIFMLKIKNFNTFSCKKKKKNIIKKLKAP